MDDRIFAHLSLILKSFVQRLSLYWQSFNKLWQFDWIYNKYSSVWHWEYYIHKPTPKRTSYVLSFATVSANGDFEKSKAAISYVINPRSIIVRATRCVYAIDEYSHSFSHSISLWVEFWQPPMPKRLPNWGGVLTSNDTRTCGADFKSIFRNLLSDREPTNGRS